jgi:hypothetical protein
MALATAAGQPLAQPRNTAAIQVRETAGIARTQYPVSARVRVPRGALTDPARARLLEKTADVPAQFSSESSWDDGSVQGLAADFNVTIGPGETRMYSLDYGPDVTPSPAPRGLSVAEESEAIQVGNVRFNKSGSPLLLSANYRVEFIGKGANGFFVVDAAQTRHQFGAGESPRVELLKRGPLNVLVRYSGRIALDASYQVPVTITFEMPNSKSWFKMTAAVDDPARRLKEVAFETPFAYGEFPWLWDFGTDTGTYGAFRNATDAVVLTQIVNPKGAGSWRVETGSKGELRPYEVSAGRATPIFSGWGHFLDARGAMAFAIDRFPDRIGTYTISFNGQGQAAFRFAPAQPATRHELTVYHHFVVTPVPIGAATSPASMVRPLAVEVK